ncbi:thioredoxin family protein [Geomonas azotofigens]|uniref:thioredoxin family protein n=1 Tax=Geomonas azotofigens TaxID=2843196 RepID=UPI001C11AF89|nr:thioredoxin family protein [Geomonas azotofigens]MBU5612999.1 thioredoxin family protein [Geomonas azotofigens]
MRRLILAAALLVAATAHAELPSASDAVIRKALASGKPTVIDLGARTCIPCRQMAPVLEQLFSEYRGKASVLFIDVHADQAAAERFRIQMIPTQIFFDAKGREVKRHVGALEKADIVKELKAAGLR